MSELPSQLSWSAVICTLNRRHIMLAAVDSLLSQTRRPSQIIIVDASDDWAGTRSLLMSELASQAPGIEWIYQQARQRSSATQRNEGLLHCRADVVFFVDDDSLMLPGCAEAVMAVYDADLEQLIGGVTTMLAEQLPSDFASMKPTLDTTLKPEIRGLDRWRRLWYQEQLFIPYDGQYHFPNAEVLAGFKDVSGVALFHGCRMSFRTQLVRELGGCNPALIRYSAGEDCDLSYRVSQSKALVLAKKAWIYHAQSAKGRMDRKANTALVLANTSALYLMNVPRNGRAEHRILYNFVLKRFLLECVRDLSRARFSFPGARGAWYTLRLLPQLLNKSLPELKAAYPQIQERIFALR